MSVQSWGGAPQTPLQWAWLGKAPPTVLCDQTDMLITSDVGYSAEVPRVISQIP